MTTGRCDQNPQRVNVAVVLEAKGYEALRSKEDIHQVQGWQERDGDNKGRRGTNVVGNVG